MEFLMKIIETYGLVLTLLFYFGSMCHGQIYTEFLAEKVLCDIDQRLDNGCSSESVGARSRTECLLLCGSETSCIGASLDEHGSCFHHEECPFIPGCDVQNRNHDFFTKNCAHGTWDPLSEVCKCVDGFYGKRCKQCYSKCSDLFGAGYDEGRHIVYLDPEQNGVPFRVECQIANSGWNAPLIMSNTGNFDFNKTWNEYVKGFHLHFDDYWVGLYAMHRMSQAGCDRMLFGLKLLSRQDAFLGREYKDVLISNESTRYSLTSNSLSTWQRGNVPTGWRFPDCLASIQNLPFSAWDVDGDYDVTSNCAARAGSGWWYSGCDSSCNALGFGLQYLNTLPRHQLFSLMGLDLSVIASEEARFLMYFRC